MRLAWGCFAASIALALIATSSGPTAAQIAIADTLQGASGAGEAVSNAFRNQLRMELGAGALFSLFLVLWSVGYIVRAIFFLPGRFIEPDAADYSTFHS